LSAIEPLQWIANAEERSAWVKVLAAMGVHLKEKEQLLNRIDELLDEMEKK
jgi:hypothetical protein